jgi:hypothetical protein
VRPFGDLGDAITTTAPRLPSSLLSNLGHLGPRTRPPAVKRTRLATTTTTVHARLYPEDLSLPQAPLV